MNDLEKLFLSELRDIYDGEQQLVEALPDMEKSAISGQLKQAFHEHWEQTRNHVNRLERVFETLGQKPSRKSCRGLEGIIDEGEITADGREARRLLDRCHGRGRRAQYLRVELGHGDTVAEVDALHGRRVQLADDAGRATLD